jgi:outer membrane lipoprotein-sorting protein
MTLHPNINFFVLFAGILYSSFSFCSQNKERGLEIALEADSRFMGWNSSIASMEMILFDDDSEISRRQLTVKNLEVTGDGDISMLTFERPKDIRGTSLLTHAHKEVENEIWLYLPAIKRTNRISAYNQSGPFVGSEFAFEDVASMDVEQYSYKYIEKAPCPDLDRTCFVVDRYPVDQNSGYSWQRVWFDTDEYRVSKIDFYDLKKTLKKSLINRRFEQYLGRYWVPMETHMLNHQTGKSTSLILSEVLFDAGLNESGFTRNALKRAR